MAAIRNIFRLHPSGQAIQGTGLHGHRLVKACVILRQIIDGHRMLAVFRLIGHGKHRIPLLQAISIR